MRRCVIALPTVFVLLVIGLAVDADDRPYSFVSLYSPSNPERVTAAPSMKTDLSLRSPSKGGATVSREQLNWEDRVPWWREDAIERGPQDPFAQESTFERSLESGLAYYEGTRRLSGPVARLSVRSGRAGGSKIAPVIAAVIWQREDPNGGPIPEPGPSQRYKGVLLIGSSYPDADNEAFFASARQAVDLTAKLPGPLKSLAERIETLVYDPPSGQRRAAGAIVDIHGVYTVSDPQKKAPVILFSPMENSSPLRIAMSLVGGGVMAARHERLMRLLAAKEASKSAGQQDREIEERLRPVAVSPQAQIDEAECALQFTLLHADRAFGASLQAQRARLRTMEQRNCRSP